jgi:hypothetical protein
MTTAPSSDSIVRSMPTSNSTEEAHACLRYVWNYGCHVGCRQEQRPYGKLHLAYYQAESLLLSLLSIWATALWTAEARLKSP